jgi:tetratricopeptide (TPR) repeat protein
MWTVFALGALVVVGCGSKVERSIGDLGGTQEEREQAKMELALAKDDAIEPLIQALGDLSRPPKVRVDIAEVLFRVYLREDDPRILDALIQALQDGDPGVRAGVATALGDMRKDEAVPPLLDALEKEEDDNVTYEILVALEALGLQGWGGEAVVIFEKLPEGGAERFVRVLREELSGGSAKVQREAREWLEMLAEGIARKADQLVLKGDLQEAEKQYYEAKDLVPDSKNINQKLGKFYYDNGDEQKGLDILSEYGMVAYARKLSPPPVIDGVLDDPCWKKVKPFTQFYQCIYSMAAYPTEGRSEAYVGYTQDALFVATKGYEPSTKTMTANVTQRDGRVWIDDDVDIYLDTDHDYNTYYQIVINSLGAIYDKACSRGASMDAAWNANYAVATAVEDTFWTCEIGIPFKDLEHGQVKRGTLWGFNVCRVRIGNASEFGQWVPTYGYAHRPERFGFLFFE